MRLAAERAAALAPHGAGGRTAFFALIAQGMALIFSGEGERGAAAIRAAVEVLEHSDELRDDPRLLAWAAMGPLWLREANSGRALADRALAVARRQSAVGVLPFVLTHVAIDQAATDRWAEAQAGFHEAIGLAQGNRPAHRARPPAGPPRLAGGEAGQVRAEPPARRPRRSACPATSASASARSGPSPRWVTWSSASASPKPRSPISRNSEPCSARVASAMSTCRRRRNSSSSTSASAAARRPPTRRREFERDASTKAQPWALARAARCRGLLAAEGESDRHFETALTLHGQTPDAFETGRTRLAYGARLRRERQRLRAREQLRAAVDFFDRLGADPWSEMARAELAATGETARRRDVTTLNDLTPQELQIALRLAGGPHDQGDRRGPVPQPEDDRVPPAQRLPQTRDRITERAHGGHDGARLSRLPHQPDAGRGCRAVTAVISRVDRQEPLDHEVHLLGYLQLEEVTCPDRLAEW